MVSALKVDAVDCGGRMSEAMRGSESRKVKLNRDLWRELPSIVAPSIVARGRCSIVRLRLRHRIGLLYSVLATRDF